MLNFRKYLYRRRIFKLNQFPFIFVKLRKLRMLIAKKSIYFLSLCVRNCTRNLWNPKNLNYSINFLMMLVKSTFLIWRNVNSPNTLKSINKPIINCDKKWISHQLKIKLWKKVYFSNNQSWMSSIYWFSNFRV